jgi:ECF sigma factor
LRPVQPAEVTELLRRWSGGDVAARESLAPLVYDELRRLARYYLASQRSDHTLQSTALVHEAYLRLAGRENVHWGESKSFLRGGGENPRAMVRQGS